VVADWDADCICIGTLGHSADLRGGRRRRWTEEDFAGVVC
jgi:hypothetical protein